MSATKPATWFVYSTLRKLKRKYLAEHHELVRLRCDLALGRRDDYGKHRVQNRARELHLDVAQMYDKQSIRILEKLNAEIDSRDKYNAEARALSDIERRRADSGVVCRHSPGNAKTRIQSRTTGDIALVGYGAVFYRSNDASTEYELSDWPSRIVERIMPHAFDRTLQQDDIRACFNHDSSWILGRVSARTLKLSVDSIGLRYVISPPSGSIGQHVVGAVRRGDVSGSSIMMRIKEERIREDAGGLIVRELIEIELAEVGPVSFPAYTGTTSMVQ